MSRESGRSGRKHGESCCRCPQMYLPCTMECATPCQHASAEARRYARCCRGSTREKLMRDPSRSQRRCLSGHMKRNVDRVDVGGVGVECDRGVGGCLHPHAFVQHHWPHDSHNVRVRRHGDSDKLACVPSPNLHLPLRGRRVASN